MIHCVNCSPTEPRPLSLREATPEDAAFLARIVHDAARGHRKKSFWQECLGLDERGTLELLEDFIQRSPSGYPSYSRFRICECGQVPIAAGAGYVPAEHPPSEFWRHLTDALVTVQDERRLIENLLRMRTHLRSVPRLDAQAWVLESISVIESHRRTGAATFLVRSLLLQGLRRGLQMSQLVCLRENRAAIEFYRQLGFVPEPQPESEPVSTELILMTFRTQNHSRKP